MAYFSFSIGHIEFHSFAVVVFLILLSSMDVWLVLVYVHVFVSVCVNMFHAFSVYSV